MTDNTKKKIVKWFWILFLTPIALFLIMILLVWAFADIPSFEDLENPDSKLATQVIASNGDILTTIHDENRLYVSYDELSPYLVEAAVATEDSRFYSHSGIDFWSLGRVFFKTGRRQHHHPAARQDSLPACGREQQGAGLVEGEDGVGEAEGVDYGRET